MKLGTYLDMHAIRSSHFARLLNVSPSTVGRWVDGALPRLDTMRRIADATDGAVMISDWMGDKT